MPFRQAAILVALALAGWAICGAAIGIGFAVMSKTAALVVHAVVAALVFAALSAVYFTRFRDASPLATAASFLAVVVALDALIVAPFIERSFAMFASVLGTWIPFVLIFAVTWTTGEVMGRRRTKPHH
jgi:hypothetical protein